MIFVSDTREWRFYGRASGRVTKTSLLLKHSKAVADLDQIHIDTERFGTIHARV